MKKILIVFAIMGMAAGCMTIGTGDPVVDAPLTFMRAISPACEA